MKNKGLSSIIFNRNSLILVIAVIVLAVLPHLLPPYPLHLAVMILLYIYFAQAWNIVGGICGSFNFLHPIYVGAGAYSAMLFFTEFGLSPWIGMLAGIVIAVILAVFVTWVGIRSKLPRVAYALSTIAFVYIAQNVAESSALLGGGERGVQLPYAPGFINFQFDSKISFYYVILVMTAVVMVAVWLILRSRIGLYFRAIAHNEKAAQAMGVDLMKYTIVATIISAVFTAIGGTFYGQFVGSLVPTTAISLEFVIKTMLFVAMGGLGTIWGPVVGAGVAMPIGEVLRAQLPQFQSLHLLLYGVVVIVVLSLTPTGIMTYIDERRARRRAIITGT